MANSVPPAGNRPGLTPFSPALADSREVAPSEVPPAPSSDAPVSGLTAFVGAKKVVANAPVVALELVDEAATRPLRTSYTERPMGQLYQAEAGGPWCGAEFHRGSPVPSRLTFYGTPHTMDHRPQTPMFTIEKSVGYWNRHTSQALRAGLRFGSLPLQEFGAGQFECVELDPTHVVFEKRTDDYTVQVSYRFGQDLPCAVAQWTITNHTDTEVPVQLLTGLATTMRPSHREQSFQPRRTEALDEQHTLVSHYDGKEAGDTVLVVTQGGELPVSCATDFGAFPQTRTHRGPPAQDPLTSQFSPPEPAASFTYAKDLAPGATLRVVQVIGPCVEGDEVAAAKRFRDGYREDVARYEESVARYANTGTLSSGDPILDGSVGAAKAVMLANTHRLAGVEMPMPCPAEYPDGYTHDIAVSRLAAQYFDPESVRDHLLFLVEHANEKGQIPHAYYWKDDHLFIEPASADNWNHFWFVLNSARYLRMTGDQGTLAKIYPVLEKSIEAMLHHHEDGLINAFRPDWWDIGSCYGARSYMTILASRSLREFVALSASLGKEGPALLALENTARELERNLGEKLWDPAKQYLMNTNEGEPDGHIYIGSLLAAHFGLLDEEKRRALVRTAQSVLLDPELGVSNVYPSDFHDPAMAEKMRYDIEAVGKPGYYFNGSWCQGTAWLQLALLGVGEKQAAYELMRELMAIDGIMDGPNGQPAFYEVRTTTDDPATRGQVDKPQFLWAASWYLYCLYHLLGLRQNPWNISFDPFVPNRDGATAFSFQRGQREVAVTVAGQANRIKAIRYDGKQMPTAVVPDSIDDLACVEIEMGRPEIPYLATAESALVHARYSALESQLTFSLEAFAGHHSRCSIVAPKKPHKIFCGGQELAENLWSFKRAEPGVWEIEFHFTHGQPVEDFSVQFR